MKFEIISNNHQKEILEVQELGERIGYGNMMSIASALWRRKLRLSGFPEDGAFVPVIESMVKEEDMELVKNSNKVEESWIKKTFND